jgi:SAM-dependent methyltransferase
VLSSDATLSSRSFPFAQRGSAVRPLEYKKLNEVEDHMWWFAGLHENLITVFNRARVKTLPGIALDVGCGTGGLLRKLAQLLPQLALIGIDLNEMACTIARAKSGQSVCLGTTNCLPFREASFAAIFSADVLGHTDVDQKRALHSYHRCLQSEGILVLNLPAYQWLLSGHDRAVHNVRRYTRKRIRDLLIAAGFVGVETTYWNTFLFPLMLLHRLLSSMAEDSDVNFYPRPVEIVFRKIMAFENFLLSRGLTLPFGGSVIATATRK